MEDEHVRLLCQLLLAKIQRLDAQLGLAKSLVRQERALADHLASGIPGGHPAYEAWLNARRNP